MNADDQRWFHRKGALSRSPWESVVDAQLAGWQHTGLRVAELASGDVRTLDDEAVERIIVPLAGSFAVSHRDRDGERESRLHGRRSVFHGPTDTLYLPCGTTARIEGVGRVAVAEAPATARGSTRYVPASEVEIELRGAGQSTRQVHNFGTPSRLEAARLIVCEVVTPAGNWSSYPPHKHDEHVPGHESRLEEIYYFESAPARGAAGGTPDNAFGMFSTYSSAAGEISIDAMVRTGDIALVPYGYHGPAVAAPGYDLYYLNVMAGPDPDRAWLITDDPAHAWVRDEWRHEHLDDRLPYRDDTGGRQ